MLCAKCGKDVPAVPVADDPHAVQCLHCGTLAVVDVDETSTTARRGANRSSAKVIQRVEQAYPIEPPPRIWDEDDVDRQETISAPSDTGGSLDSVPPLSSHRMRPRATSRPSSGRFCWLLLSLGVALFTCGACLIGYSLLGESEALWDLGAPLVLAGQATFLVGLVLQLDVIWQQNKDTSRALRALDQRLSRSDQSPAEVAPQPVALTETAVSLHSGTTAVAAPHVALRDLQGRLEAFGSRLSRRES